MIKAALHIRSVHCNGILSPAVQNTCKIVLHLLILLFQIMNLVSVYFNHAFFSHFPKLIGQSTSVHSQIIRKLLPVKGNNKPTAALLHHLLEK